ncbi:hypothetical protein GALMADRAFT_273676 [Galerina marginata CBS 339.88]|uniref:Uncharacterized protein n=1 Tax=Galerina marginata (strain CBS 339.88) TaxID=685588 RepID=A0A067S8Q2_GALM3|nr:hypothetical protein GALMADRAFT_273676 [Galerina marginata CBS 339.88]
MRMQSLVLVAAALSSSLVSATVCWKTTSASCAGPQYGTKDDLRIDADNFCPFVIGNPGGRFVFGFQSAMWYGQFANVSSCLNTFNKLVNDCYGTGTTVPNFNGGNIDDAGGAHLTINFGTCEPL